MVEIYDPKAFRKALDPESGNDEFVFPDEQPQREPPNRTTEGELWARCMQRILNDRRGHTRPALHGTLAMARRIHEATATAKNFAAVTGVIKRAIIQSSRTGQPNRFPPLLMVSPHGIGKTLYCRCVASAMATTCVPIAINATSDRGALGGLSSVWRGAKIGKLAKGLLIDSMTAAPLCLLDELDKASALVAGENTLDALLSAFEPENARNFIDEYLEVPIRLKSALWLASANDPRLIPEPPLSRMIVIEIPPPTRTQAAKTVHAIADPILQTNSLGAIADSAVDVILDLSARDVRKALEIASAFAVNRRSKAIGVDDVPLSLDLLQGAHGPAPGFSDEVVAQYARLPTRL